MNTRPLPRALLACLCIVATSGAVAQGFTSVSSLPPPATAATVATAATDGAGPAPSASLPELAPVAPVATLAAFTSVSSLPGDGQPAAAGSGPSLPGAGHLMADRILVEKGARKLTLLSRGQVIAEYPIKLGLSPRGHKQFEGDFRTPEGTYYLSRRNPRSEFFLSVEVSYPNEADRERAKREGLRPGGMIMIHGQPNVPRRPPEYYANTDWTDGCIAVSNSHMVEIWQRTRLGIPIEIRP